MGTNSSRNQYHRGQVGRLHHPADHDTWLAIGVLLLLMVPGGYCGEQEASGPRLLDIFHILGHPVHNLHLCCHLASRIVLAKGLRRDRWITEAPNRRGQTPDQIGPHNLRGDCWHFGELDPVLLLQSGQEMVDHGEADV